MKIAHGIPVLNNFRGLTDTIWSAKSHHDVQTIIYPNYRFGDCLSKAWNELIKESINRGVDYILITNDDILFSQNITIDNLVKFFEQTDDKTVLITARAHNDYLGWDPAKIFDMMPVTDDYAECPDFSCFMIRPDFFDKCGSFDEGFRPAWHEDGDMHRRINLLGYKAYSVGSAPYYHYLSVTGKEIAASNPQLFIGSKNYYISKWGGYLGSEPWEHPYNDESLTARDWR